MSRSRAVARASPRQSGERHMHSRKLYGAGLGFRRELLAELEAGVPAAVN